MKPATILSAVSVPAPTRLALRMPVVIREALRLNASMKPATILSAVSVPAPTRLALRMPVVIREALRLNASMKPATILSAVMVLTAIARARIVPSTRRLPSMIWNSSIQSEPSHALVSLKRCAEL